MVVRQTEIPMPAGYAKRTLPDKLGIKPGFRLCILNAPADYETTLGPLPSGVQRPKSLKGPLDFIQFFTRVRAELEEMFPKLKRELRETGTLWVSWPKGSSRVATDLTEGIVREIGLKNHLVDIKVCAVDEIWSGLKFVYRLRDRKTK